MESDSVIYGLLGRVHLLMRRVSNRITDVEYMRVNKDYAREVVRLAMATGNPELAELCGRLRLAMELDAPAAKAEPASERSGPGLLQRLRTARPEATHPTQRYVGSLR
ncbi:MAG: hypothetical protein PHI64_11725 [Zoogloea sp.]|uniref:hypothetical protein n=1 Tax=Zoogloea sp. TaxID=49181 RepID=UPI00260F7D4C|nr:hypothetical protein [Zoogloea sp.]MDD2989616.1 hypothetical protein [Zoogloea sp.]